MRAVYSAGPFIACAARTASRTRLRTAWCCASSSSSASRHSGSNAAMTGSAESAPPPVRRRHVTTAFVQRPDGAVLLVQRSGRVGTYQHQWGAISGGLEEGDESAAYRAQQEVLEEADLPPSQLRLVRGGRPLLVDDPPRHFCVHPFLLALTSQEAAVQLNWENEGFTWHQPGAIRGLDTVPLLAETYERVALGRRQAAAVRRLAEDRSHGAAQLAAWAARALGDEAAALAAAAAAVREEGGGGGRRGGKSPGPLCLEDLRNLGWLLATCRPSMAAIANSVAAVLAAAHEELHARADAFEVPVGEVCAIVQQAAAAEERRLEAAAAMLRRQLAALLRDGMTILTTSLSSSILDAVKEAAEGGLKLQAVVCEARPLCEGVQLAEAWAQAGVEVTLITDAQASLAGLFVREADLVLVGADAITASAAVNKAGTYLLALAAKAAGVPMWAVADSGKLSPGPLAALALPAAAQQVAQQAQQQGHEEMAAEEVTAAWGRPAPQGVRVRNIYFEDTPLDLLAGVVTEEGRLDGTGIEAALAARRQQYRTAFQLA
ncbi:hypothetical protein ABPG75_000208 [Micractinium tetrahymenae]